MSLRLNGSTSGYSEIDAPAIAGNNTLVLPTTNGSAHQLLKNSGTAGTLEYGVTLPSGNGLAHQLVKNSSSAGTWEYGFTLPSGNGLADQVLGGDGAGIISWVDRSRMVLETAKSATGTAVDFTDIPSWVKRITVMFDGVSTNGTSIPLIQLGDSGGIETTGYTSKCTAVSLVLNNNTRQGSSTDGVRLGSDVHTAAAILTGNISINNISGDTWIATGIFTSANVNGDSVNTTTAQKTLSATLDTVRITTVNGTDTFDDGSINLLLEG
jgi:hypothetical protein